MEEKLIELCHVSAGYEGRNVLHDISLTISKKDFLGIIGPNGGGKTTLIKVILGLLSPTAGTITYYHEGIETLTPNMGYLPQYTSFDKQFPISVKDVILSGKLTNRSLTTRYSQEDKQKALQVMNLLGLESVADKSIGELSGGQRQRALIGRALVCDPEMLILDEPGTYIDAKSQEKLYELLADINKKCAIVMVSHDIGTVLRSVRNIACVNHTMHYHPIHEVDEKILEEAMGCPFQLVAHGHVPHRVLEMHDNP